MEQLRSRNKGDCVPNLIKMVNDGLKTEKEEAYIVDGFNWLLVMACKKNKEAPPFWESFIVENISHIDPKGIKKEARTNLLRWYFIRVGKAKYNDLFYQEYKKVEKDFSRTIILYKLIRSEKPVFNDLILKILKKENKKVKKDLDDWLKNNKYVS